MITAQPEVTPSSLAPRRDLLIDARMPWLIFAAMLALYLWRLSLMALWDNDETTYAEIAWEIWQTGDWLTMHFRGLVWFCHPPLYYWSVALLDRLLGYNELAARLPSAMAGAGVVSVVYVWGRRMLTPRAALIGALCLGLNFQFYTESRMALLDTMLHLFSFWSILAMWDALHGQRAAWKWVFIASGLACLSKGPFGLIFPWMIGLPYMALTGRLRALRTIPWAWSLAALAIGGTWYGLEIQRHGRIFFDTVLIYFAVKRMVIRVQGQGTYWWVYLAITAAGLFPWSVYIPSTLLCLFRRATKDKDVVSMLLVSILVPFVFFTIAETKLPNYIVFAYPGIALAIGWYLDRMLTHDQVRRLMVPAGAAAVVACLFVVAMKVVAEPQNPQYSSAFPTGEAVCAVVAAALSWGTVECWRRSAWGPVPSMAVGMAVFLWACSTFLAPLAEPFRPIKTLGLAARPLLAAPDELAMFGLNGEYGLTFYAEHYVTAMGSEAETRRVFNTPGKVLAVLSQSAYQSLSTGGGLPLFLVARSGGAVLVSNQPMAGLP